MGRWIDGSVTTNSASKEICKDPWISGLYMVDRLMVANGDDGMMGQ